MDSFGDKRRYLIVGSVILEIVTPRFRSRLEKEYKKLGLNSLQEFLGSKYGIHPLFHQRFRNIKCCTDQENCGIRDHMDLVYCQWTTLYTENQEKEQHSGLCHCRYIAKQVDLSDLDITLAGTILVSCFNLYKDNYMIRSLVQMKSDYMTHNTRGAICEEEFQSLWTDLMYYVLEFDPEAQDELLEIQQRRLDMEQWYNCAVELLNIQPQLNEHMRLNRMRRNLGSSEGQSEGNEGRPTRCRVCSHHNGTYTQQTSRLEKEKTNQTRPYELGQLIFFLHHTIDLKPVMADMLGDINNYLGVTADDTCIGTSLHVNDGVMLEGDKLIFCFPNMCALLICDMDGLLGETILLSGQPRFVTAINRSTIAVTIDNSERIEFYDINTRDKIQSIDISKRVSHLGGISMVDNKLIIGADRQLVFVDHMTRQEIKSVDLWFNPTLVHGAEAMVYTSGRATNHGLMPSTFGDHSNNLFCYNSQTGVNTTVGVTSPVNSLTSLSDGSLYIVCEDGSLFHMSSDGTIQKKIQRDQLEIRGKCPLIRYNKVQKKLMAFDKHTGHVQIFHEL